MYHPFSIAETIKTAWDVFKKNFITIIVYSLIAFLLISVLAIVIEVLISPQSFYSQMLVSLILVFIQAYSTLGLYKLIFTLIDSEYYEFEFSQVVPTIKMMFSYLTVVFLVAICFVTYKLFVDQLVSHPSIADISALLGVIVGLYLALRIMFFNTFIVDDNSGPIESLKQSFALTKDCLVKVLSILGIIILLIAIPAIISQYFPPFSLLIVFSYPFVNIILIVTYRKLIYSHKDVDDVIAETL